MAFQIDITNPALADAEDHVRFIREVNREPTAAEKWFRGLIQAIYSREDFPGRFLVIPEHEEFPLEIRHLIYFSHRIIFRLDSPNQRVIILRIYHGAVVRSRRRIYSNSPNLI